MIQGMGQLKESRLIRLPPMAPMGEMARRLLTTGMP
jgi:hypothetical protein